MGTARIFLYGWSDWVICGEHFYRLTSEIFLVAFPVTKKALRYPNICRLSLIDIFHSPNTSENASVLLPLPSLFPYSSRFPQQFWRPLQLLAFSFSTLYLTSVTYIRLAFQLLTVTSALREDSPPSNQIRPSPGYHHDTLQYLLVLLQSSQPSHCDEVKRVTASRETVLVNLSKPSYCAPVTHLTATQRPV